MRPGHGNSSAGATRMIGNRWKTRWKTSAQIVTGTFVAHCYAINYVAFQKNCDFPVTGNGNRWKTPFPDTPGIHLAAQIRRKIKKRKKPHLREEKKGTSPFLPPHTARFPDRWMKGHGPATYPPCRADRTTTATPKPPPPTTGWLDLRQKKFNRRKKSSGKVGFASLMS